MQIESSKDKLKTALSFAEKMTGKNLTLPILGTVLLVVDDKSITIRATNLDIGIEITLPVKVHKKGIVAVPGNILNNLLSNITDETISLEVKDGNLFVQSQKNKAVIKSFPNEDFPTLPVVSSNKKTIQIKPEKLVNGLRSVWYSASVSDIKPEIASVFLGINNKTITFTATDSFRLAEKIIDYETEVDGETLLVPIRNVAEIIRVFDATKEDIKISFDDNQISFKSGGIYLTSRLIQGVFPDYKQIIPKEHTTEVIVLKQDFVNALKTTTLFADKFNQITLVVDPKGKTFSITSRNPDVGENTAFIDSSFSGEGVSLNFNHRYVVDSLQSITTDSVSLQCNGGSKPLVVQGVGDRSFTALIMPLNQ